MFIIFILSYIYCLSPSSHLSENDSLTFPSSSQRTFSDTEWQQLIDMIYKHHSLSTIIRFITSLPVDLQLSFKERPENLLEICMYQFNFDLFKWFIQKDYPLDKLTSRGNTVFIESVYGFTDDYAVMITDEPYSLSNYSSLLIQSGCNIHKPGNIGTALSVLSLTPHDKTEMNMILFEFLLIRGADPEDIVGIMRPTSIEKANEIHRKGLASHFVSKRPPLFKSVEIERFSPAFILLDYGVDITKKTPDGFNIASIFEKKHYSSHLDTQKLAQHFLEKGIQPQKISPNQNIGHVINRETMQREVNFLTLLSTLQTPFEILETTHLHYPLPHDYAIYNYSCVLDTIQLLLTKSIDPLHFEPHALINRFIINKIPLDIPFLLFYALRSHEKMSSVAQKTLSLLLEQPADYYGPEAQKWISFIHKDLSLNLETLLPFIQTSDPLLLPFLLCINHPQEAISLKKLLLIHSPPALIHDPMKPFHRMTQLALDALCIESLSQEIEHNSQNFHQLVSQKEQQTPLHPIDSLNQLYSHINKQQQTELPPSLLPEKVSDLRVFGRSLSFIIEGHEYVIKIKKKHEPASKFMGHSVLEVTSEKNNSQWGDLKPLGKVRLSDSLVAHIEQHIRTYNGIKTTESIDTEAYIFKVNHTHYFDYLENTSLHDEQTFLEGLSLNLKQSLNLVPLGCLRSNLTDLNHDSTRKYLFGAHLLDNGYWFHGVGHIANLQEGFGTSNFSVKGIRDPDDYYTRTSINSQDHINQFSDLRKTFLNCVQKVEGQQHFNQTQVFQKHLKRLPATPLMELMMSSYYQFLIFYSQKQDPPTQKEFTDNFILYILNPILQSLFPDTPLEKWVSWINIEKKRIEGDAAIFLNDPSTIKQVALREDSRDFVLQNVYNLFSQCLSLYSAYKDTPQELSSHLDQIKLHFQPSYKELSEKATLLTRFFQEMNTDEQLNTLIDLYSKKDQQTLFKLLPLVALDKQQKLMIDFLQKILTLKYSSDSFSFYLFPINSSNNKDSETQFIYDIIQKISLFSFLFQNGDTLDYLLSNKIYPLNLFSRIDDSYIIQYACRADYFSFLSPFLKKYGSSALLFRPFRSKQNEGIFFEFALRYELKDLVEKILEKDISSPKNKLIKITFQTSSLKFLHVLIENFPQIYSPFENIPYLINLIDSLLSNSDNPHSSKTLQSIYQYLFYFAYKKFDETSDNPSIQIIDFLHLFSQILTSQHFLFLAPIFTWISNKKELDFFYSFLSDSGCQLHLYPTILQKISTHHLRIQLTLSILQKEIHFQNEQAVQFLDSILLTYQNDSPSLRIILDDILSFSSHNQLHLLPVSTQKSIFGIILKFNFFELLPCFLKVFPPPSPLFKPKALENLPISPSKILPTCLPPPLSPDKKIELQQDSPSPFQTTRSLSTLRKKINKIYLSSKSS